MSNIRRTVFITIGCIFWPLGLCSIMLMMNLAKWSHTCQNLLMLNLEVAVVQLPFVIWINVIPTCIIMISVYYVIPAQVKCLAWNSVSALLPFVASVLIHNSVLPFHNGNDVVDVMPLMLWHANRTIRIETPKYNLSQITRLHPPITNL